MASKDIVKNLVDEFVERGYTWSIGGINRPPSYDDMRRALDQADTMLQSGECMEMGRLWISKINDHLDVYMLMGDYNGV